ncbi:MAG: hypothetical protein AMXMBFR57_37590 [Acidimicrobiia bacterium]|jgi:hypothetical protein
MDAVEERIITLEARGRAVEERMQDHRDHMQHVNTDLKTMISALDDRMERRFDTLDKRFVWVVALQFATLLAILTGFISLLGRQ